MGKARNLADLLDDNGDVKSASLDNVPASNNASALTTGTLPIARIADDAITNAKLATGITASKLTGALPAISAASLTNVPKDVTVGGRKNMLHNGAMNVWQRGTTSLTGIGSSTETFMADRFKFTSSGDARYTLSREADAPAGFKYSYKFDCTTVGTSTGTSRSYLEQGIEGQDLQHLQKGLATAKPVTLSFWVKTVITGVTDPVFRVNLQDASNTRILGGSYTYDTSTGGWQKFTITFVGDTTGAITDNANRGMWIEWWLYDYGYYSSGSIPTSWESQVDADRNSNSTGNVAGNTSNYWQIAGVQLELGDTATDFEHRSYGEELALCQRYYERFIADASAEMLIGVGVNASATGVFINYPYKQIKRVIPSFSSSGASHFERLTASWGAGSSISCQANIATARLNMGGFPSSTTWNATEVRITAAANNAHWFAFDAEL